MISPCGSVDLPRHTQTLVITMVVAIFEEVGQGTIVSDAGKWLVHIVDDLAHDLTIFV